MRGADLLSRFLAKQGVQHVFTLSGNQILPVFDALLDTPLRLIHVRHEAAAVHMADATGRLSGRPGVALVSAGPGFANTLSALYVARMAESPVVLLGGEAPQQKRGRLAFQAMQQVEMARPVAKQAYLVQRLEQLIDVLCQATTVASSGRPGPVYVSLPADVLEAEGDERPLPVVGRRSLPAEAQLAEQVWQLIGEAQRPIILAGPAVRRMAAAALGRIRQLAAIPAVGMESPRGLNDPSLGAFAEVLPQADLICLLGKRLDFSLNYGDSPALDGRCTLVQIDADESVLDQTRAAIEHPQRLQMAAVADPIHVAEQFAAIASQSGPRSREWLDEVEQAIAYRPPDWDAWESPQPGEPMHPVAVCRTVQRFLAQDPQAVFVCDGGEFGQWAQACIDAPTRLINGPSGAIGSSLPMAIAARLVCQQSRIVVTLGDGTFGFHAMEFDTALRYALPFIAVVGNDAAWNAELQAQRRTYGEQRAIGCELLPTRYDQVVEALGGYGATAETPAELARQLDQALRSGLPACLNVPIGRFAAPIIRRAK